MRPIATDVAWFVLGTQVSCVKTGEPFEMPVGAWFLWV